MICNAIIEYDKTHFPTIASSRKNVDHHVKVAEDGAVEFACQIVSGISLERNKAKRSANILFFTEKYKHFASFFPQHSVILKKISILKNRTNDGKKI